MKRLLPLINVVLLTAISFLGVDAFYKLFAAQLQTPALPKPIATGTGLHATEFEKPPLSEYRRILERNIFGSSPSGEAAPEKIQVEKIKPTERDLKLWGTVVGGDPGRAYAIIEAPDGKSRRRAQLLYRHGDVVQGAEIKKILREKVILRANGQNEILSIVKPQSSRDVRRIQRAPSRSRSGPIRQRRILRSAHVQNALRNIDTLMNQARIRPHAEGFQISRIRPSSIFRRMGLRNGDVITAVDSQPINSVDDAMRIWQNLSAGQGASLELNRRGRSRVIEYKIR